MEDKMYDIAIIGAGPAGMTAAIYAGRAEKAVALIDKDGFGGQIAKSPKVENIPGFTFIRGMKFAEKMYRQICLYPTIEHIIEEVTLVQYRRGIFMINLSDGSMICSRSLIIASGNKPRELSLNTKNVYYCVTCDGPFFKGQDVIVVGSGNTGAAYALELANYCRKVYICDITMDMMCERVSAEKLKSKKNVVFLSNCSIKDVRNDKSGNLEAVVMSTGNEVPVKAIFGAAGMIPQTKFVSGQFVRKDDKGYIVSDSCESDLVPGLFIAGDCRQKDIRQVTTAVSDGTTAAIKAMKFINGLK